MKVLIVKASALGDVVHALPVLPYLNKVDPASRIDWLVEEPFAPLLENHPLLSKIHWIDTRLWRKWETLPKAIHSMRDVLLDLRNEHYDVVLDLQGNSKSGLFTLLSNAPRRYGFHRKDVREWPNLFSTNHRVTLTEEDYHVCDRSLKVVSSAFPAKAGRDNVKNLIYQPTPLLMPDGGIQSKVSSQVREYGLLGKRLVLLHAGTTWKTKCWPVNLWKDLALSLTKDSTVGVVLTWGNEEELAMATTIQRTTRGHSFIWPKGNLKELLALLSHMEVVVGGDTGPVHIAAALGKSTVSIFRATDARRNGPRGEKHICLQSPLPCSPCLRKECPMDDVCGHTIQTKEVLEAIHALLAKQDLSTESFALLS